MPGLSTLRIYSHLASELAAIFNAERDDGLFFFNTVKFVKFISLTARNMNSGTGYISVIPL